MKVMSQTPKSPFSVAHRGIQMEQDIQYPIALRCLLKMQAGRPQDEKCKVGGGGLFISACSPLVPIGIHGGKRCMEGETRNSGGH